MTLSTPSAHRLNSIIGLEEKAVAVRCNPSSERESAFEGTFYEVQAWFKKQEPSQRRNIKVYLPDRGVKPPSFSAADMINICGLDL